VGKVGVGGGESVGVAWIRWVGRGEGWGGRELVASGLVKVAFCGGDGEGRVTGEGRGGKTGEVG